MPAYTSITFSFPRPVQPDLITRFYQAFLSDDVAFKSVFAWSVGDEAEKTLEEILAWNQKQAELKTPPDEEGYMQTDDWQVCLDVQGFYECRLIQSCRAEEIWMRCIVPEGQVSVESIAVLERAALRVWDALPVSLVETSGELDTDLGFSLVSKGIQPSVMPFAIVDDQCAPLASTEYFNHEKLSRGVILRARIEDETQVLFEETGMRINELEFNRICDAISPQLIALENPRNEMSIETLVELVKGGAVQLTETDLNQLVFIAHGYVSDFRSPHLKGTWIDGD